MKKKPVLVLDLDHTLIHSMPLSKMLPGDAARLQYLLHCIDSGVPRDLLLLPNVHTLTLTKLRPFVHEFLQAASTMFELYVYTMGAPSYAAAVARVLDPSGCLFEGRVISRCSQGTIPKAKSLAFIPRPESSIIILDDTPRVWHSHLANLIAIDRYHFFTSTTTPSLLGAFQDECASDGALARTLHLLRLLHADWQLLEDTDVRKILSHVRSHTLRGCKVAFPTAADSFWILAQQLGATCSTILDESVTHVIAGGTQIMDLPRNAHVVNRRWIEAAYYTWARPSETLYAADAVTLSFSETTLVFIDSVCTMGAPAHDHHHQPAAPLIDALAAVGAPDALSTTSSPCSHHLLPRREPGVPSALPPLIH